MSDDKSKKDFRDRDRVAMQEEHEVAYWTGRFGVSKEKLQKAVDDVGNMVTDLEEYFKGRTKE